MKNFYLLFLILAVMITACSTVDLAEKRQEVIASALTNTEFFLYAPDALKSQGFTIVSSNEADGSLRASRTIEDKFRIDYIFYYDFEKSEVNVTTINTIKTPEGEITEYYTLEDYNSEYKSYFHPTLSALKNHISKKVM
jgi:hypothetical protein